MRLDPRLLAWGVFLIALGAVPLLVAQGYLDTEVVRGWWSLWPVALIALGVSFVLRGTPLAAVGTLVSSAMLGVILGGLLAGGGGLPFAACGDESDARPFPASEGEVRDGGRIEIRLNCGALEAVTGDGPAWRLEGADDGGAGPEVEATADEVRIESRNEGPFTLLGTRDRWALTLPTVPIDLDVNANAAQTTLDLRAASLAGLEVEVNAGELDVHLEGVDDIRALRVNVNAGSATVSLPSADLEGELQVNAGSMDLCAAPDVGLQIRTNDNVTASNNFAERGLTRSGEVWETPGFANAAEQVVLDADVNAASVELNDSEACGG